MKSLLRKSTSRFLRRSQTGQSIVILALGFVALLAFVGIVTDVSLMFVRYTQLRRAVDAAAIAAAGQMRQDRTIATVGLAARQFIEFHGIDPEAVVVETCASSPDMDTSTEELDKDPELCTEDQRKLVRVTAQIKSETVFLRLIGWGDILLEASALSETATLDVVLIMDVSESMLAETTYEDWADIGLGMVYRPPHWQYDILPQKIADGDFANYEELWQGTVANNFDDGLVRVPQEIVNRRLYFDGSPTRADGSELNVTGAAADYEAAYSTADDAYLVEWAEYPGTSGNEHPRTECTVRYFPGSLSKELTDEEIDVYSDLGLTTWPSTKWGGFRPTYNFYGCCNDPTKDASVDVNGNIDADNSKIEADGYFEDLICQPFKKARDATRLFLQQVDFIRGDRVAYVTFGRSAYILTPYTDAERANGKSHMIDNYEDAKNALNQYIGVRAEPSFYNWDGTLGHWTTFMNPDPFATGEIDYSNEDRLDFESHIETGAYNSYPAKDNCPYQNASLPYPLSLYASSASSSLGLIMTPIETDFFGNTVTDWSGWSATSQAGDKGLNAWDTSYEAWGACRDTNIGAALREANNALLDPRYTRSDGSVWVMILLSDGAAGASDPVRRNGEFFDYAEPYAVYGGTGEYGVPAYDLAEDYSADYGVYGLCPYGTASNPGELVLYYDDTDEGRPRFPYCSDESPETRHFCNFRPAQVKDELTWLNDAGYEIPVWGDKEYTPYDQLVAEGAPALTSDIQPPFQISEYPAYSAYDLDGDGWVLSEENENAAAGFVYDVDIYTDGAGTANPSSLPVDCDPLYDVDDYARDWADYIGLGETSKTQLPSIFTIGFGLNFDAPDSGFSGTPGESGYIPGDVELNPEDYLGEELLRYIADVGDNSQMDIDYQQDYLDDMESTLDLSLIAGEDFDNRGPCEGDGGTITSGVYASEADMIEPLGPTVSCGNYFNAPSQDELEQVFDEIASRMFTRLAG